MNKKKWMGTLIAAIVSAALIVADQYCKSLAILKLKGQPAIGGIEGIFDFLYVENTGAAFSMLEDKQWLFVILAALISVGLLYVVYRFSDIRKPQPIFTANMVRICSVMIIAGGIGNAIDRVRYGFVVDFIHTTFINFPVFNVADILITTGAILFLVFVLFRRKTIDDVEAIFSMGKKAKESEKNV